jgi:predicted ATPase
VPCPSFGGRGDDAQLGLHAAASLARLLRGHSRLGDAPTLDPVYDRFGEGFETADLESAKTLLDALGHAQ